MIMFSIAQRRYLVIDERLADAGERWNIKKLPGRFYADELEKWVVPIRPGLSKALVEIFKQDMLAALIEELEREYIELLEPPAPGSIDPFSIPAGVAVELATTHHLHDVHDGDKADYNRIHLPYKFGE